MGASLKFPHSMRKTMHTHYHKSQWDENLYWDAFACVHNTIYCVVVLFVARCVIKRQLVLLMADDDDDVPFCVSQLSSSNALTTILRSIDSDGEREKKSSQFSDCIAHLLA